jgi:antitoxin VapB
LALSLKDAETDRLAREVARLTGESVTEAVRRALAARLARERRKRGEVAGLARRLDALARDGAVLPDRDGRNAEEIIGYDAHGLPG